MHTPHHILKQYWGYNDFRPLQLDIINNVLCGRDTLALLPTGGGKSLCFQVPALCMDGICIVVSPLIALMKDQVENLRKRNVKAAVIFSGMSKREVDITLDNCVHGPYKFLYLSPERLMTDIVRDRIALMNVNLLAVDESHCISQWGYDFRPPYLKIAEIRNLQPHVPVLALTASATLEVQTDIMEKMQFKEKNVFRKSFERKNIHYIVQHENNKLQRTLNILNKIKGTSIIYTRNRRKTEQLAKYFADKGIAADFYHAGLMNEQRSKRQDAWVNNNIRLIVATNAFGMGIDKPDVRTVIHFDVPDNLEAYYQEAGRAGRDEQNSFAVILYNDSDIADLNQRLEVNFPPIEKIKAVYTGLCNFLKIPVGGGQGITYNFDIIDFCNTFNFKPYDAVIALKLLQLDNYISLNESVFHSSRIKFIIGGDTLYQFQVQHASIDSFIKVLLRSYEGLFDEYVSINETEIAKRSSSTLEVAVSRLNYLHNQNVIEYIPFTDSPQLTFVSERIAANNFAMSKETYAWRKVRYSQRLEAMKNYVTSHEHCRNMLLLSYFDEKLLNRCGTCDYCRARAKLDMDDTLLEKVKADVLKCLHIFNADIEVLHEHINYISKIKLLETLRWMLDSGSIKMQENSYSVK